VDANIPHTGLMFHKQHPDGRKNVWDEFDWGDPWGLPRYEPAIASAINKNDSVMKTLTVNIE
jgi:hypothetical protein